MTTHHDPATAPKELEGSRLPHLEEEIVESSACFGTFFIGDSEFALSTDCLREVVQYPPVITRVPLAPSAMRGIFSLRGEIVPVLDLAVLLGMKAEHDTGAEQIAILEHGRANLGLVLNRTGAVLQADDQAYNDMVFRSGEEPGPVSGILKVGDDRLIQTISPAFLGAMSGSSQEDKGSTANKGDERTYSKAIVVRVGEDQLAFRIDQVLEIQGPLKVQGSPEYFDHCLGVVMLRGTSIAIMDLREALGRDTDTPPSHFVFVGARDEAIGLAVDGLVETLEYPEDRALEVPGYPGTERCGISRSAIALSDGRHIMVVEVPDLLEEYGVKGIGGLLGVDRDSGQESQKQDPEHSYITFRVGDHDLSLPLEQVAEVQEVNENRFADIRATNGSPGLLEVRGDVLPLIDCRTRMGLASQEIVAAGVALVVQVESERYGVLVDAVVDIRHVLQSQVTSCKSMLGSTEEAQGVMKFLRSALLVDNGSGSSDTLLILDVASLLCSPVAPAGDGAPPTC